MKKKVILSFDYELFFGDKSGTVMKSLIEPTNAILDAMDSVNAKGNFFVDWQMLKYLQVVGTERTISDYELIVNQLHDMIRRGHRIELHIHPHWVDAKYRGDGTWDFSDFRHYSLHSFSEEEIVELFVEGINLLTDIAREVDPEYKIVAFRAGGWAIQPFSKLKKAFQRVGIVIDSSVALGTYGRNQYSYFNFQHVVTSSRHLYRFDNDVVVEDEQGDFVEVPIATYNRHVLYKIIDKLYRILSRKSIVISDGTHSRSDLKNEGTTERSMVTMSKISPASVLLSLLVQKSPLITLIDHPKDYTPSVRTALKLLRRKYETILYTDLL